MNPLSFIPTFDVLFTEGLPLYASARISLIIFGSAFFLTIYMLISSLRNYNLASLAYYIVLFVINATAILLFSLVQGLEQIVLLGVVLLAFIAIPIVRKRPVNKVFFWTSVICIVLFFLIYGLFRIPVFRDLIAKDRNIITQITIDSKTAWKVSTSSLSESLKTGLLGSGNDTFSIIYNQYRPLNNESLILKDTNFTFANSHILNTLGNLGLIGIGAWFVLGLLLLKQFIVTYKKVNFDSDEELMLLLFLLMLVYIYVSSIFIYFTYLVYFLLFLGVSYVSVLTRRKTEKESELFVFNLGFFVHGSDMGINRSVYLGSIVLVAISFFASLSLLSKYVSSGLNIVKAEKITAIGRELLEKDKLSEEEKAKMLIDSSNLYGKAVAQISNNAMAHRRASMIVTQYIEYLAQKYNKSESELEKDDLFDEIVTYVEIVVEEAKKATEFAPGIYANWNTRATIYSKLVGLGLNSYSKSALTSMQEAVFLNPLNYELYYNAGQLYVINDDTDQALRTLSQVFAINPEHIPSLILAGELSIRDKDYKQADRYFADAKKVMDRMEDTNSEIYTYVIKKLNEISGYLDGSTISDDGKQDDKTRED